MKIGRGGPRISVQCLALLLVGLSSVCLASEGGHYLEGAAEGPLYYTYGQGRSEWERSPYPVRETNGWVSRTDFEDEEIEEKEKNKGDGGLYGLFGLFGLMGILPFIPILLGLALLFVPIPVIPQGGRSDDLITARGIDMHKILSAVTREYSTISKMTAESFSGGCLEKMSCTVSQFLTSYLPPQFPSTLTGLIGDNKLTRRIRNGMSGRKDCRKFKCDLS